MKETGSLTASGDMSTIQPRRVFHLGEDLHQGTIKKESGFGFPNLIPDMSAED